MKKNSNNNLVYMILLGLAVVAIIVAGVKFLKPSKSNSNQSQTPSGQNGGQPDGRQGFNRGNFKPLTGTVQSIQGNVITMKADDGSMKNVTCSSSTKIMEQQNDQSTTLSLTDIKNGDTINVMASSTDQTNIDARMIFVGQFTPPQGGNWHGNSNGNSSTSI